MLNFSDLMAEIKSQGLPESQFAVFGSGPMLACGLREWVGDIDLVFTEALFAKLKIKRGWNLCRSKLGSPELRRGNINAVQDWRPEKRDIKQLIARAELFVGVRFVSLFEVRRYKRVMYRPKDKSDLKLISVHLRKNNHVGY